MGLAFGVVLWWAAVVVGAQTLVSLIQHLFQLRLADVLWQLLTGYRALVDPLFDALYAPLQALIDRLGWRWTIPLWLRDLHALSALGAALMARGDNVIVLIRSWWEQALRVSIIPVFTAASGLGLAYMLQVVVLMFGGNDDRMVDDIAVGRAAWTTVLAVAGFYALNALMLRL